jgi:DNA-binding transcriptional LysR family regulator
MPDLPPTLRSFDLNLLLLFDALYRDRKLGVAAAAVGLSQPGASQALTRMRQTFDDPLFVRQGGGMNPTPKAHAVAPMVRQAIALLERGLSELRSFDPTSSDRQFRLGLTTAFDKSRFGWGDDIGTRGRVSNSKL